MATTLETHRKNASDLSLGSSHQMIYEKASQLVGEFGQGESHMDFGSGQGSFVQQLNNKFQSKKITGVDLMERPPDLPQDISWLQADLNGSLSVEAGCYDSISALEIIEHLENPRHVFRELYRLLKKNGHLILSTPNNESWRAILSYMKRGHFVAFTDRDYPAHITPLNRKDLLRAATEAGFEFISWDYPKEGCLPGLTKLTWQGLSFGMLKGLRYTDNIFIVLKK